MKFPLLILGMNMGYSLGPPGEQTDDGIKHCLQFWESWSPMGHWQCLQTSVVVPTWLWEGNLASSGYRPGMWRNILQCIGKPFRQRIIQPRWSLVLSMRNSCLQPTFVQGSMVFPLHQACVQSSARIISWNLQSNPVKEALLQSPYYQWINWGLEKLGAFVQGHGGSNSGHLSQ